MDAKYLKFSVISSSSYCTEYQAIYNAYTNKPSSSVADAQNAMVQSLVTDGIWSKFDVFYVFAGHTNDSNESLLNWKSPGTYNASLVNFPTFTQYEGFTGNGTDAAINTNWNPNTNGVNYEITSASIGAYVRINIAESRSIIGIDSTYNSYISPRNASNALNVSINSNSETYASNSNSTGLFIGVADTGTIYVYRNGSQIDSETKTLAGKPNANMYALYYATTGYSTNQISIAFAGSKLSSSEVSSITTYIETYMDSNGKGVI